MSYEQERAREEHIKREATKNGAHYCSECKHTKSTIDGKICLLEYSPYKFRMERGDELYKVGMSIIYIDNLITKQFPCEFGENK
jgi:hypothetical protein